MRFIVVGTALLAISSSAAALDVHPMDPREIIVHGRRSEQFRIPKELRTLPAEQSERWRNPANRNVECHAVGPRGCGPPLMRIFTVGADGKTQIGEKKPED